jgi:hypothetical protein
VTASGFRSKWHELYGKGSERKSLLFACSCCRLAWHLMPDHCHRLVETVEQYADHHIAGNALIAAFDGYYSSHFVLPESLGSAQAAESVAHLGWKWRWRGVNQDFWYTASRVARSAAEALAKSIPWDEARHSEVLLLQDIYGEETAPVSSGRSIVRRGWHAAVKALFGIKQADGGKTVFDPNWRTSTVVAIARGMYESRDFATMPILSDALQDAGCENEDILNHCRSDSPHVRGCWVVDLILGKQ